MSAVTVYMGLLCLRKKNPKKGVEPAGKLALLGKGRTGYPGLYLTSRRSHLKCF